MTRKNPKNADGPIAKGARLTMKDVDPEDALRAFMQVDPEKVKEAERQEQGVREGLDALAPRASQVVLSGYIGWSAKEVAERPTAALGVALEKLPVSGKIRGKNQQIVKAMTWVLGEVPAGAEGRDALAGAIDALLERV